MSMPVVGFLGKSDFGKFNQKDGSGGLWYISRVAISVFFFFPSGCSLRTVGFGIVVSMNHFLTVDQSDGSPSSDLLHVSAKKIFFPLITSCMPQLGFSVSSIFKFP